MSTDLSKNIQNGNYYHQSRTSASCWKSFLEFRYWRFENLYLSCKQILQNPIFCLRKFEHLTKKNKEDWIKAIQSVKNSDIGIVIISYLKWNLKEKVVNPPCYHHIEMVGGPDLVALHFQWVLWDLRKISFLSFLSQNSLLKNAKIWGK